LEKTPPQLPNTTILPTNYSKEQEKATFYQQIGEIQDSLDMVGMMPLELPELIDRAFTFIAIEPALEIVNVSEGLPLLTCQHSKVNEKCQFISRDKNHEVCRLDENRHMPWKCWHPHYWSAPLYELFDFAVCRMNDNYYAPETIRDIQQAGIFLNSLNDILSAQYVPIKSATNTAKGNAEEDDCDAPDTDTPTLPLSSETLPSEPDGNVSGFEVPDANEPIPPEETTGTETASPSTDSKKITHTSKWLLIAIVALLIREYREHIGDPMYRGLSADDIYKRTKNQNPNLKKKKNRDTGKEHKNGCVAVRTQIKTLKQILGKSFLSWKIESRPYRLVGEGDINFFERDIMESINRLNRTT
jgi:hypothetical protein